jgi:hypothetical protein
MISDNLNAFSALVSETGEGDNFGRPPNLNNVLSSPSEQLDEVVEIDTFNLVDGSSSPLLRLSVPGRSVDSFIFSIWDSHSTTSFRANQRWVQL